MGTDISTTVQYRDRHSTEWKRIPFGDWQSSSYVKNLDWCECRNYAAFSCLAGVRNYRRPEGLPVVAKDVTMHIHPSDGYPWACSGTITFLELLEYCSKHGSNPLTDYMLSWHKWLKEAEESDGQEYPIEDVRVNFFLDSL